jgi:RNA polymerase sigma-70 factor (ECF subfamily)
LSFQKILPNDFGVERGTHSREYNKGFCDWRENEFMNIDVEIFAIKSAQKGDDEAWRSLFEQHFGAIYRYCLSLGCGQQDMAEDVTQQVFVTAARNIRKFKPHRATFRAWLVGIAKNCYMKVESKEVRHRWHETQFFKKSIESRNKYSSESLVHEVLAILPVHYRLVLEAKYLRGQTVRQIAESQEVTVKATESLLARAREKFAQVYKQIKA